MSSTATQPSSFSGELAGQSVQCQLVPSLKDDSLPLVTNLYTFTERKDDGGDGADDTELSFGYSLRRFTLRALLLVIVPRALTAYFCVIEWFMITKNAESNQYGHRNALWVYYSWFIVGVFGLGISKFGLAGVEAAMLQDVTGKLTMPWLC
ncbi:hypothetical protein AJ79_07190 [Helicocarpus griseus UAMH5409]|uniref:Uncharacterized protein n=1 Tax=Helicocarpus griseus UAMH5409 TaxID=1447875 RepID=A0A2B7X5F6_9EURO|nr:hypothetical protein AJ79_07190 [Helicocarpus griseus UAMH5409]